MRKSKLMKALLVFGMSVVTATSMVGIAACNPDSGNGDDNGNGNGHQHSYDGWLTSSTQHWHECLECSEEADRGNHVDVKNNKTDAAGADNYCDVCGYELAHSFNESAWKSDATGHWHEATCEHTTEKGSFAAHVDADKNNVCDTCDFVGATSQGYKNFVANKITEKATKVLDNTFFVGSKLPLFTSWGNAGLYASHENETNKVDVSGGKANLVTPATEPATCLYVDFGDAAGSIVEGFFKISDVSGANGYTAVQFTTSDGTTDSELFGLRTNKGNAIKYRILETNGSRTEHDVTGAPTWGSGATAEGNISVYYKYDVSTNKITVTINDTAFVTDLQLNGTALKGIKFSSGSGNADTFSVDDIIVIKTPVDVEAYKNAITANSTAERGKVTAAGFEIGTPMQTADQALQTALSDANATTATLTEAYNTWFTNLLVVYGNAVKNKIMYTDYLATDYDDPKNEDAAAYTAAVEKLGTDLKAAKTVENVTAAYKAADTTIKALHNDDWWTLEDVVVTVGNGTTGANTLTVKTGDTVTEAQLKALVTPAAGYAISGFYADVDCTDGNQVTFPLTITADTTVYAKLVKQTVYNLSVADVPSAAVAADGSQVIGGEGGFFTALGNVKSESAKMNSGTYTKQVSLTKGKASATNNAIKFTVTGEATITVVAGAKSDKPEVKLAVLDASGNAVTPTDIKLNGAASAFENLPVATTDATAEIAVTYTFKLPAGTYCIGGSGGGAYIFALTVAV